MSGTATDRVPPTSENCRFCWMCRHVCPVGHVTARETLTPHAWALTIESVTRGQLAWNEETAAVMFACADCGLCRSHCVTDQPLPDAIVAARAAIVRAGLAPAAISDLQRRLEAAPPEIVPLASAAGGAMLVVDPTALERSPGTVDAAMRLLQAVGSAPAPLVRRLSTGLTASSVGLHDVAATLARAVVADVVATGASEVLVLSPGDKWAFEYVYPRRLGVEWPGEVEVTEVTSVLDRALEDGRLGFRQRCDAPYAYHDPCHSSRIRRDAGAPRRLLAAASGEAEACDLFWRADRAHPCGALGGLEITHPAIALQLANARFGDAAAAGARALVTDDPLCLAHLREHASGGIAVVGLYELLVDHLA